MYKLTNKLTGHSFKLSFKETGEFFFKKNAYGEYINWLSDYELEQVQEYTDFVFWTLMISTALLSVVCFHYFFKWN